MRGRLAGKVVLITGAAAGRGLGAAQAALFAREGAALILTDVLDDEGARRVAEIRRETGSIRYERLDVTREADWTKVIESIDREEGKLDVLVNNAGIFAIENLEQTSLELWQRVVAINQTGVFLGMRSVLPLMRKAGGGSIINFSSIGGLVGFGPALAYQATKGAIRTMSKNAAIEYARENIRVNSIHPGVIVTQMADSIDPLVIAGFEKETPMGLGTPEDIAYGALFLAADESRYMTGAELVIDGGYTAR